MAKRVIRLLIYEGSQEGVDRSLNRRAVVGREQCGDCSIQEYFFTKLPLSEEVEAQIEQHKEKGE